MIEIEMTLKQANEIYHQGQCYEDVVYLSKNENIAKQINEIHPIALRNELKEYGAWDEEQLKDHEENLLRLLWIRAGDIIENQ